MFKLALKEAAEHEQRSMVNMLEVLLCDYCDRKVSCCRIKEPARCLVRSE